MKTLWAQAQVHGWSPAQRTAQYRMAGGGQGGVRKKRQWRTMRGWPLGGARKFLETRTTADADSRNYLRTWKTRRRSHFVMAERHRHTMRRGATVGWPQEMRGASLGGASLGGALALPQQMRCAAWVRSWRTGCSALAPT